MPFMKRTTGCDAIDSSMAFLVPSERLRRAAGLARRAPRGAVGRAKERNTGKTVLSRECIAMAAVRLDRDGRRLSLAEIWN